MPKILTTNLPSVDIRHLARKKLLIHDTYFGWKWDSGSGDNFFIMLKADSNSVVLSYSIGSDEQKREVDQRVELTTTPCHFGKSRPWFVCPYCHQRAAILFLGLQVACRRCYSMAYRTQRVSRQDREIWRVNAIRRRLNWQPGFFYGHEGKPKGMHLRTYIKLIAEHDARALPVARRMLAHMERHQERLQERIARMLAEHPEWNIYFKEEL